MSGHNLDAFSCGNRGGLLCSCPSCVRERNTRAVKIECDREHVTEATLSSLLRQRQELRDENEVLEAQAARDRARCADLESKLAQCMADIDKARDDGLEEAAAIAEGFSSPTAKTIAESIRLAKRAG